MKKISLLLIAALILMLASCASPSEKDSVIPTEPDSQPTFEKTVEPTDMQTDEQTLAPTESETEDAFSEEPTEEQSESTSDASSVELPTEEEPTQVPTEFTTEPSSEAYPTEPSSEAYPTEIATEPSVEPSMTETEEIEPSETASQSSPSTEEETSACSLVYTKVDDFYSVTGYTGTAVDVVIPEVYEGVAVTSIGAEAFSGCLTLKSITLGRAVETIGQGAFKDCKNLQSVFLPANLISIEANAFQRCVAIQSVTYGGAENAFSKIEIGVRNQTLTNASFTYLNEPSIHDEPEEVLDKIYTIIEPKTMTLSNGDLFNYRMYVPDDYDATKAYPVLILLHGAGERGDDNTLQMKNMVATLFADEDSPIHDAIFLCPQCPIDNQWVDTPWADGDYRTDEVPESNEIQGVLEMLASVRDSYHVDADRIYVMGISMGGFGTWDILIRHPDIFAAAIPICGGGDSSKAELIAHIPIRTFHGDADKVVPVDGTRAMVEALQKAGGNVRYEELPGYGHNVWDYVAEKEGLMDWLFSQCKGVIDIEVNIGDLLGR